MDNKVVERSNLVSLKITDAQWQEIAISGFGKRYCKDSPHHSKCFFSIMHNKLKKQNSDFIVCNHDLLVANLKKLDPTVLQFCPMLHSLESCTSRCRNSASKTQATAKTIGTSILQPLLHRIVCSA